MKNILFVGTFPPHQKAGGENATYNLARAIKAKRFNVFVLSMGKNKFFERYKDHGMEIYRVDKFYENRRHGFSLFQTFRYFTIELFNPFIFLFTIYLILKYRINIVHLSTFHQLSSSPLIAAKLLFRKTLITFHSHELFCSLSSLDNECKKVRKGKCGYCVFNIQKLPKGLRKYSIIYKIAVSIANNLIKSISFFNLKVANLANYITFPSVYLRNFYIKYGLKERDTIVTYNFLNSSRISKENVKKIKKLYKIKNERIILFVGNMLEVKGPDVLLNAFKLLKEKGNLKLVFVGHGPFLEELKKITSRLKLGKYVIFTGWIPNEDLKALYDLSDIVVIPSVFPETFSLIFLEAFSSRKVVIASDIGALSYNIVDEKNGFLVKPNDPKELAKKISYVLKNFEKLESIRKRAYNETKSKYNPSTILNEYKRLYS
jgi:glycosyltransferase involved in cell wall biosynthesis